MTAVHSPRFAVVGEALIDLVDSGDSPYIAHAGGSPLNVAIGLSRLGRPTAFLGRLSGDPFGTVLRRHATRSHVDLSRAVSAIEPSTIALVELVNGIARYEFSVQGTADFQWTDAELDRLPTDVAALHFGSLASWLPPGDAAISRLVGRLRAAGQVLLTYDPNVRPALQPDAVAARDQIERAVATAHVVKASEDDLAWLYGAQPAGDVARRWLRAGPHLVVITRGGDGAVAYIVGHEPLPQPVHPAPMVDTVGAGDSFMSGLLDGLARLDALTPAAVAQLVTDPARLGQVLAHAALVSAITCSRAGASPPWADELADADQDGRTSS